MRLIDADELIKRHCATECGCTREECGFEYNKDGCDGCTFVIEIENEEPVEAEPARHGRWVYDPNGMDFNLGAWVCSECKVKNDNLGGSQRINPYHFVGSRYCPNCGAKMDGGEEHEAD